MESSTSEAGLVPLLEECAERLRATRRELDETLSRVEAALAEAVATDRIEALLEAHHEKILRLVRGDARTGNAAGQVFPFRMDPVERVARVGRRRVPLTESEFRIVELMWEEMPSPVSRRMIVDRLYEGREAPSDQVVDMFIFRIRQKFTTAGCTDAVIQSVRGSGWRLALRAGAIDDEDEAESERGDEPPAA